MSNARYPPRDSRWKVLATDTPYRPDAPASWAEESGKSELVFEAYDLLADPGETRNLYPSPPAEVVALRAKLEAWLELRLQASAGLPPPPPNPALEKTLREQGYWEITGPSGDRKPPPPPGSRPGKLYPAPQAGRPLAPP
jgi:hypothetical protein